ncbi:hypothetical protein CKO23_04440 [Thiocystis violacea]|nr:hypothetical protein [Thiocystis violacea]
MKARLITGVRDVTPEGGLIEFVIWRVPEPIPPSTHLYKYRMVFVVAGKRIIGFDNARGKGDHCHIDMSERPYVFTEVDQLIEDFIREVERWRNAH